ncbi:MULTISPECIES: glycosyltransferase family 4 protein [unclassified Methanoregula]|uniref:glycosyltransferase family 4 protein n=1 Tax=unclassified Methanoregula TaxID=2649730 RepID=UPI0009D2B925|nr:MULTISPECIES: glycosyltransferase family 4 protein [unclassified Methanoregula]OPX65150.1 MAG: UDP-D-galactose:(glucosyl)lipopolysaccharide-1,6-D-galactosyltransferase [Methanoregula sp. PtaB.Bin085]OPY32062.1 MAG: UDP-D-galactose:(glucosyl)lipopolysaccharide-1,6-D-galactosyltransferase [Methanoregula sp. PtaU1.Bin006]
MKIAFVYDAIFPYVKGGGEKRIHEIAVRLAARGHDVHLVGMKYWDGPDMVSRDGISLHGICPAAESLYVRGRRSIRQALRFSLFLVPFLIKERFDIIECQQFPYFPCFSVKLSSAMKKTPFVIAWYEVWGNYWYDYLGWPGVLGKCTERLLGFLTRNHIAISERTARSLDREGIFHGVTVFPVGISTEQVISIPAAPEQRDIIFVGRLIREKHADLLVSAFIILAEEYPELTLFILGDGPEKEAVCNRIRACSCRDRITLRPFLESHDQVIARIKSAHVLVLPSTREGFGIVALEALACGLPVVTVNHPDNAICDMITPETGFIADLSEDDLAGKIRLALDRYPAMKDACMASAARYSWDQIIPRLEEYYQARIR